MVVKAEPVNRIPLRDVRGRCQLTQQELADRARISRDTVRKAEAGNVISLLTAYALLEVLNEEYRARSQPELSIDEIDWRVEGR